MANGRRGDTVPLMGLLGQIEKKRNRDVNEIGDLMKSFQDLAKEQDSIEGYESAKQNISNLPDVNAFVKAKKGIMLKQLDNEIKSQQTFNSLESSVNNLIEKVKKDPTSNFNSMLADMTMTIASNKNMISEQENLQLSTLLKSLDDYSSSRQVENEINQIKNSVNVDGETNRFKANMSDQRKTQLDVLELQALRKGDTSKMQSALNLALNQEEEAKAKGLESVGQYGGANREIYYTTTDKRRNLAGTVNQVSKIAGQDKANPYLSYLRTEGLSDGEKIYDPDFYINQADQAADIIHGFIFGGDLESEFLSSLGSKWSDPKTKKDDKDRWKPEYVKKMIDFVQTAEEESGFGNKTFSSIDSRKLRGFKSAIGFEETKKFGNEMATQATNLWSQAVDYYNFTSGIDKILKENRLRTIQAQDELGFEPEYNVMD